MKSVSLNWKRCQSCIFCNFIIYVIVIIIYNMKSRHSYLSPICWLSWRVRRRRRQKSWHRRVRQGGARDCRAAPVGFGNKMYSSAPPQHPPHTKCVFHVFTDSLKSYNVPIWDFGKPEFHRFNKYIYIYTYMYFSQQGNGDFFVWTIYIFVAHDSQERHI